MFNNSSVIQYVKSFESKTLDMHGNVLKLIMVIVNNYPAQRVVKYNRNDTAGQ